MTDSLEDLYLEAEEALRNSNYLHAKQIFDSIINEEPDYVQAHNSLGWLYKSQIEDFERAEKHFLRAIYINKNYPHSYNNCIVYRYGRMGKSKKYSRKSLKCAFSE